MRFRAIAPIPRLAPIVKCLWTLESEAGEAGGDIEPVLPDGCPELIVQFGDPFDRVAADGTSERQSDILFAGQLTGQISLLPTGSIATVGIRFHPGSAAAVLRMPQLPLLGTTHGVECLDRDLWRGLGEVKCASRTLADAVERIQGFLCRRMAPHWLDPRVLAAVKTIQRCHGQIGIESLALHLGMTRRHLERRFDSLVGVSPKRLARIARFQRALRRLTVRPETPGRRLTAVNGAATAVECGYADQPHFIREFTELAGCPPGAHLLRHARLSGFFTSTERLR